MHYTYILFDLDGTVTESGPGITNSVRYALQKMGRPALEEAVLQKFVGPPLADSMMRYSGMTADEAAQAITYYREYYTAKGIFENSLYPGVEQMLKKLCQGGKVLALSTSKPELFAVQILEHFQIRSYFQAVCGASMDEKRVEKEEVIRYTLETLHVRREQKGEVLMVGDREYDVYGARQNGLSCMGVTFGYGSREELQNAGAIDIVDSPAEVAEHLLRA